MRTCRIEDRTEIDAIIRACKTCCLALCYNNQPYVLPMNFALDGDVVILHAAQEGRMWETLKANPRVCINWVPGEKLVWQDEHVACSYRVKSKSVIVEGKAAFVEDYDEKYRCLQLFMRQYSTREFKFGEPSVKNVGIIKVHIETISAKEFGTKA